MQCNAVQCKAAVPRVHTHSHALTRNSIPSIPSQRERDSTFTSDALMRLIVQCRRGCRSRAVQHPVSPHMYTTPCTPTAAVKDTHAHAAVKDAHARAAVKDTHAHGDTRMATGELAACGVVSICCNTCFSLSSSSSHCCCCCCCCCCCALFAHFLFFRCVCVCVCVQWLHYDSDRTS